MAQILADRTGALLSLGTELGRGGEGSVFEVPGRPGSVAKIYRTPPGQELAAKLAAMSASGTAGMSKLAAWPTDLLLDRGRTVGFLMPKVSGFRPAFELYGPKLRLQRFPKADWRFLIRAATNTARAFAAVHEARQVIGDVNHGNLVIGQDATVRLIDCDSFQISSGGRTWFCQVGVPTHQPPEMQGLRTYAGFMRTPNHDAFGLAVLIFQMLCMARHPYSGRWLSAGDPPPMEEAIRQFLYAYSADRRATRTAPPPGSLPIEALGATVAGMFEDAFLRGGAVPGGRPTATRWIAALDGLAGSLRKCAASPGHHYLSTLRACPWCALEDGSGVLLFPVIFVGGATGTDGFMVLWHQVEAVPLPVPRGRMPDPLRAAPSKSAKVAGRRRGAALATLGALAIATWIAVCAVAPKDEAAILVVSTILMLGTVACIDGMFGRTFKAQRAVKRHEWRALQADWMATSGVEKPASARKMLDTLKVTYDALVADRNDKLHALQRNRQASQLSDYLDRFRIAGAGIRGVGDGKAAILQSNGVETAADIMECRILLISGFGPKTVANLVAWRNSHAGRFRFDPAKPVSPTEIGLVENAFAQKRRDVESQLSKGLADLRNVVAAETRARAELLARHAELAPAYGQSVADSRAALFYS